MAQTITPVVHGGSRARWAGSIALHVLGAALGAAAVGLALGGLGSMLGAPWGRAGMLLVAALALAYAAREAFGLKVPIPEVRRQVPEWWRGALGPRISSFLYGLALGPGFLTHLRHGTFVVACAVVLALGEPVLGAALLAPFGVARAVAVGWGAVAGTDWLERMGAGRSPQVANAIALVALAVAAAGTKPDAGAPASWVWTAILCATFAWAAMAKVARPAGWSEALRVHGLPPQVQRGALFAVPVAEASVALLLLSGAVRAGAALATVMLAAFSASLLAARRRGHGTLPCGCFGGRSSRKVSWLIARNLALASVAAVALVSEAPLPFELPGAGDAVPAALTIAALGLAAWLFRTSAMLWSRQEVRKA